MMKLHNLLIKQIILYYIKNPNILADKIVEIYDNNPDSKVYNPNK